MLWVFGGSQLFWGISSHGKDGKEHRGKPKIGPFKN